MFKKFSFSFTFCLTSRIKKVYLRVHMFDLPLDIDTNASPKQASK